MDPLELDSFLNPEPREDEKDESSGEHLRPSDSEENVYALLDDRPEHELTPPRGMDTMSGSAYGFGIEMGSLEAGGSGAERLGAGSGAIKLSAGARSSPDRGAETQLEIEDDPLARWDQSGALQRLGGVGDDEAGVTSAPMTAAKEQVGEGEQSDGYHSSRFELGRHVDEESRRSLRQRLLQQERERSRRAAAVRPQRLSFLLLIGGILILGAVAAVLVYGNRERLGWLSGIEPVAVSAPLISTEQVKKPAVPVVSVRDRIRRALRFGLPLDAPGARAGDESREERR